MLLTMHIFVALGGLATAGLAIFVPLKVVLRTAYWFTGLTLISGSLLVVGNPAHLKAACTSGLVYLSLSVPAILIARRRQKLAV